MSSKTSGIISIVPDWPNNDYKRSVPTLEGYCIVLDEISNFDFNKWVVANAEQLYVLFGRGKHFINRNME